MGAVAEKLGLREFARSDFIALLDHILQEVPVRRLIAGCAVPAPPPREPGNHIPTPAQQP